jgi:hypothetical protein
MSVDREPPPYWTFFSIFWSSKPWIRIRNLIRVRIGTYSAQKAESGSGKESVSDLLRACQAVRVGQAAGDPRYALLTINVRTFVVQVPVKPDGLPEPQVTHVTPSTTRERFTLPKKLICMNTNGSYTAETHQVQQSSGRSTFKIAVNFWPCLESISVGKNLNCHMKKYFLPLLILGCRSMLAPNFNCLSVTFRGIYFKPSKKILHDKGVGSKAYIFCP